MNNWPIIPLTVPDDIPGAPSNAALYAAPMKFINDEYVCPYCGKLEVGLPLVAVVVLLLDEATIVPCDLFHCHDDAMFLFKPVRKQFEVQAETATIIDVKKAFFNEEFFHE